MPSLLEPLGQPEQPENEMALWLENASPSDPAVVEALSQTYAQDMHLLIRILFESNGKTAPEEEFIQQIITSTLSTALADLKQFRGAVSVRVWIFGLCLRQAIRAWRTKGNSVQRVDGSLPLAGERSARAWQIIELLDGELRLSLALRYLYDLAPAEIASILKCRPDQAHRYLIEGREIIQLSNLATGEPNFLHLDAKHRKVRLKIQASLDELTIDRQSLDSIELHLQSCLECQEYIEAFHENEKFIQETLLQNWERPTYTPADHQLIMASTQKLTHHTGITFHLSPRLTEWLWIGLMIAAILFALWYMQKQDISVTTPPSLLLPAPTPGMLEMNAAVLRDIRNPTQDTDGTLYYFGNPWISNNGRWVAYGMITVNQVETGVQNEWSSILYDRGSGKTTAISPVGDHWVSNKPRYNVVNGLTHDGRWIVFTSNFHAPPNTTPEQCLRGEIPGNCMDIYLMDRIRERVRRVTETRLGQDVDGFSLAPFISPDGRWITFWSTAANLVDADQGQCEKSASGQACLDLFIYDRIGQEFQRVPIGRALPAGKLAEFEPAPISADGTWLAITLHSTDQAGQNLAVRNPTDVFLYDRTNKTFLLINQARDFEPGNGPSRSAVLSSDGRYLAFSSLASNLVSDDTNARADVFRYDRWTSSIERVSIAENGQQGNGHSGGFFDSHLMAYGRDIDISLNGRYVLYRSGADNLALNPNRCPNYELFPCSFVYMSDLQKRTTEIIFSGIARNSVLRTPSLSPDGRWALVGSNYLECPYPPVCADIQIHDRNIGLTSTIIHGGFLSGKTGATQWRGASLFGEPTSGVKSLDFSPDGRLLASGAFDSTVSIWKVANGERVKTFNDHNMPVTAVAFSPDGAILASASYDGTINLYDVDHLILLLSIHNEAGALLSLAFSPDGKYLALGGSGLAWIWEIQPDMFCLRETMRLPDLFTHSIAFSPDSRWLAMGMSDGAVWLKQINRDGTTQSVQRLGGHSGKVFSLEFIAKGDGMALASGGEDGAVNVWNIGEEKNAELRFSLVYTFQHQDWVNDLAFTAHGRQLAVVSLGSGLRFWDLESGDLITTEPEDAYFHAWSLAYARDGSALAVGSAWGNIRLLKKSSP